MTIPSVDLSHRRLWLAGWSTGDACLGSTWHVIGFNGENVILATGATQREAWWNAFRDAENIGMAGREFY